MAKKLIKGFLVYRTASYWDDDERVLFRMHDPRDNSNSREVMIREHSFEVDVPDNFDPRPQQIDALEREKQKVRAEMSARITELTDQINKLQALENNPSENAS